MSDVDIGKAEQVAKEGAIRLRVLAVEENVSAKNHAHSVRQITSVQDGKLLRPQSESCPGDCSGRQGTWSSGTRPAPGERQQMAKPSRRALPRPSERKWS